MKKALYSRFQKKIYRKSQDDRGDDKIFIKDPHLYISIYNISVYNVFKCFKCATCGTSLKNQGYYNFNNKLYCDIHARQAAINNPPTGTEGYVPVPIKP